MKKWIIFVMVFCFGLGVLKSQNDSIKYESWDPVCGGPLPLYYSLGLNYSIIASDIVSKETHTFNNQSYSNFGLHLDYYFDEYYYSEPSLQFGLNFINLGYEFKKDNLNQNYELSYIYTSFVYKLNLFESTIYVTSGVNLNYLYDVESEIETLNNNNEKLVINRDLSGSEISNNYNRFDLVGSVGIGYDILMDGYYISTEPKYNFSFLNHINENNQELKGMNFKNEFWSLNFGVTFAL